jgi:MFS family permease
VSSVGDQIQVVAIAWHIYVMTGSALQLGLVGVARAVPYLTLNLVGGAVADAVDRKKLLMCTQMLQAVVSAWLVIATVSGAVSEFTLYAATFLSGAAQAFDLPPRQALITNVVPRDELANAFNLNTLLRQTSSVVGPGIGGVLIATVGLGWSYAANSISFVALTGAVLAMGPVQSAVSRGATWDMVVGGLRYGLSQPLVRWPLLMDFTTRAVGSARGLLPIYAKDVFATGAQGLGWLSAALSLGAVAGGLVLGARGKPHRPVRQMIAAYFCEGAGLVCVGLSPTFWVALIALFGMGVANVMAEVPRVTMVQLSTPDELRGRVSALTYMFTYGGPQIGQLDSGALASGFGAPVAAMISGTLAVLAVLGISLPLRGYARQADPAAAIA